MASTTELISGLLTDVRTLLRQEVALARAEVREEVGRGLTALALVAVAAGTLAVAGFWVLVAITRAIAYIFHWPLAAVYGGVGIVLGIAGAVMLAVAWQQIRRLQVLPKTRETLREQAHRAAHYVNETA